MGGGEEGMTRAGLLKIDLSKEYLLSLGYLGGKHRCILRKKKTNTVLDTSSKLLILCLKLVFCLFS